MSYSTFKQQTQDMMRSENHFKVKINVFSIDGAFIERITRTVMSDEGKQYVTVKIAIGLRKQNK